MKRKARKDWVGTEDLGEDRVTKEAVKRGMWSKILRQIKFYDPTGNVYHFRLRMMAIGNPPYFVEIGEDGVPDRGFLFGTDQSGMVALAGWFDWLARHAGAEQERLSSEFVTLMDEMERKREGKERKRNPKGAKKAG